MSIVQTDSINSSGQVIKLLDRNTEYYMSDFSGSVRGGSSLSMSGSYSEGNNQINTTIVTGKVMTILCPVPLFKISDCVEQNHLPWILLFCTCCIHLLECKHPEAKDCLTFMPQSLAKLSTHAACFKLWVLLD